MFIAEYIKKMRDIQQLLLEYLENDDSDEQYSQNLDKIKDFELNLNEHDLKLFLHLISQISTNHHRCNNFLDKIETIIKIYEEDIKKYFSNFSIFNIFRSNKRILLFLFKEKIIIPDDLIYGMITSKKYARRNYPEYFFHEFKSFYPQNYIKKLLSENPDLDDQNYKSYEEKRKIGENDSYICELIRNDSIKEFIIYVNKKNLYLSSIISPSIYETNPLFLKNEASIIEYAAFFGSIQIFNYLRMNNVELTENLWIPTIHSQNAELIHLLEENQVKPIRYKNYGECCSYQCCVPKFIKNSKDCIYESIKCHHIEIMNYLKSNLSNETNDSNFK